MKRDVCENCGTVVDIYRKPAMHGFIDIQIPGRGETPWWKVLWAGHGRDSVYEERGVWCSSDCFIAWIKSKFKP